MPRVDVAVERGRFVAKPADQRGPHVGGNIDVPRSTQPVRAVSVYPFPEEKRLPQRALPGTTIRLAGWTRDRKRAEPGLRGNSGVRRSQYMAASSVTSRGEKIGRRPSGRHARCTVGERLSGLRFVECWLVVASALAARCNKLTSLTGSKGSSGEGASGIGSPA